MEQNVVNVSDLSDKELAAYTATTLAAWFDSKRHNLDDDTYDDAAKQRFDEAVRRRKPELYYDAWDAVYYDDAAKQCFDEAVRRRKPELYYDAWDAVYGYTINSK
jgi:hypothetical protein